MKYTLYSLLTLILCSFVAGTYQYRSIQPDDFLVITYDNNYGIVDWDNGDKRIAFESDHTGKKNIYFIDLMNLTYNTTKKGFHTASYLDDLIDKEKIYVPLTKGKDTIFHSPKWSPNNSRVLSIGEHSGATELFYTNRNTLKLIGTGIKDIVSAHWKSNNEVYTVSKNTPKTLSLTNIKTLESKEILKTDRNIFGISNQKGILYISCENEVIEYNTKNKKAESYKMPVDGKTAARLSRLNFLVKNKNGEAQIIDLNNGFNTPLFPGAEDSSPALSKNERFLAFYSKFLNGIVIKRLSKKYY